MAECSRIVKNNDVHDIVIVRTHKWKREFLGEKQRKDDTDTTKL